MSGAVTQAARLASDFMFECAHYLGDCAMQNSVELALRQAFAKAIADERERCAGIAEAEKVDADDTGDPTDVSYNMACDHIANAIRASGGEGGR